MPRPEQPGNSGDPEHRMFIFDGQLPRREWRLVAAQIGEIAAAWGIAASEVEPDDRENPVRPFSEVVAASLPVGEPVAYIFGEHSQTKATVADEVLRETYAGPTASRSDFFNFGKARGISHSVAGRAWSCLTHVYSLKVNSDALDGYPWYDPERF
jgi:hypothetical protein